MELCVNSSYWGQNILGRYSNQSGPIPPCLESKRYFHTNAAIHGRSPFTFERQGPSTRTHQVKLNERHFVEYHRNEWDLYFAGISDNERKKGTEYRFVLIPQRHDAIDFVKCRDWPQWTYIGACRASMLRLDLEEMIIQSLKTATTSLQEHGKNSLCCIDIYMDSILCRDRKRNKQRPLSVSS